MTCRTHTGFLLLVLAAGLAGCDGGRAPGPTAPSPGQQPIPQPSPQPTPAEIQLVGIVYDAAWRPLAGARVEVIQGPRAGLSTTADATGLFRLSGAFDGTTYLRATKEGHVAATLAPLPCAGCSPNIRWAYFYLEALGSRNVAGDYSLTFIADSACADMPNEALTRTYGATVTLMAPGSEGPANSWFNVTVSGSTFLEPYNSFVIGVAGDYLAADVGDWEHGGVGLVEQVGENRTLTLSGRIRTSVTDPSTISSSFHGAVDRCELTTPWGSRYNCSEGVTVARAQCLSENHQLTLRRR